MRRFFVIAAIATVILGMLLYGISKPFFESSRARAATLLAAEDHLESNSGSLADDTRRFILEHSDQLGSRVASEHLPVSIRPKGIAYAVPHSSYLALVFYHSPDEIRGFRIWIDAVGTDFTDKKTAVPHVFRFRYNDDYPESPKNRNEG